MLKYLVPLAVTITLGGCGGGSETSPAVKPAASFEASLAGLHGTKTKLSAAAAAVDPGEAARQFMDFAEARFSNHFPIHATTGSLPPLAYRYYPSTGTYLGVVVTAGMGYDVGGVYVLGGAFGSAPLYAGLLTDFIDPVDPGPGPTGRNNGCDDFSLAAVGTRVTVEYENFGADAGTQTWDFLVARMTTFEGHPALEQILKTVSRTTAADGSRRVHEGESRTYALPTGDAEISHYGVVILSQFDSGAFVLTNSIRTVYSPPWVDRQYGLAVGASDTSSATGINTSTVSGFPGIPDSTSTTPFSNSVTMKYVGRESVTVPAGTYTTCKLESGQTADGVFTQWVIVGKGITVKTQSTDKGVVVQSSHATSVKVNGQAI